MVTTYKMYDSPEDNLTTGAILEICKIEVFSNQIINQY